MKRKFRLNTGIIILYCFFTILLISFVILLINSRIVLYKRISGVMLEDDLILFVLKKDDLDLFYKNKTIYVDSLRYKFTLEKNILRDGNIEVYIKCGCHKKVNELVDASIMVENVRGYNIFKVIWEV